MSLPGPGAGGTSSGALTVGGGLTCVASGSGTTSEHQWSTYAAHWPASVRVTDAVP